MQNTDWTPVAALVVSVLALFVAGLSLWLHWRRHVQEAGDRQPEIISRASQHELGAPWRTLTIQVRNLDKYGIVIESFGVLWPLGAKIAYADDCRRQDPDEPWEPVLQQPERTVRKLVVDFHIKAASNPTTVDRHGVENTGDSHSFDLVVSSRPRSAHSLKVFIRQSSSSTSFKVRNRIITARLPEATPTKSADTERNH